MCSQRRREKNGRKRENNWAKKKNDPSAFVCVDHTTRYTIEKAWEQADKAKRFEDISIL